MKAETLTRHLLAELHRMVDANAHSRSVVKAMHEVATDPVLKQTLARQLELAQEEKTLVLWLLQEQGEPTHGSVSRPVEVIARDGWLAAGEKDAKLRDLEIASVSTQLQSYHLASWWGIAAWLRVLELQDEADKVDALTTALRTLEREIETLRPSLAQLTDNPNDSTDWYKPSSRRYSGNITSTSFKV